MMAEWGVFAGVFDVSEYWDWIEDEQKDEHHKEQLKRRGDEHLDAVSFAAKREGERQNQIRTVELVGEKKRAKQGDRLHLRTRLDYKWLIRTDFEINL